MHALKHDLPVTAWGTPIVLPKGTRVGLVKGASGTEGDLFAVSSVALLQSLTGNKHDPVYRYLFVAHSDVEESTP
jgi:hypothetical protein